MVGSTISHYEVLEKLGEGGMGAVYKARDIRLDRLIALKILSAMSTEDSDRRRRFVREAKSASALNHVNIVTIYDIDTDGTSYFIAMEYIAGRSLHQMIPRKGMRLSDALRLAVQIADALATAHHAGIVHRDLKPGNVMVTAQGAVKVVDFGLAKLIEPGVLPAEQATQSVGATSGDPLTEKGYIVGTLAYMSPEQAESKSVDGRSDVFSMGCLLYEMLTGRRAFQRDSKIRTLSAILSEEPERMGEFVDDLPPELERIVNRCLRKERERRFQHMDDLKIALEELKEESDSGQLTIHTQGKVRSQPWALIIPSIALVLIALSTAVMIFVRRAKEVVQSPLSHPIAVTTYRGTEENATLSPDGRQVAFSGNVDSQKNFDLYVKLIGADPLFRLTQNPDPDQHPVWSPDGRWIAFSRYANPSKLHELYTIDVASGVTTHLSSDAPEKAADPIYSYDGQSVYFVSDRTGRSEIWKIPVQGGHSIQITKGGGRRPLQSSDDKFFVYVKPNGDNYEVIGIPIGSAERVLFTADARFGRVPDLAFAHGALFYMIFEQPDLPMTIRRLDLTTGVSNRVVTLTPAQRFSGGDFTASPDGKTFLYWVIDFADDLMQIENFR